MTNAVFTFNLSSITTTDVVVMYETQDDTAVANVDYAPTPAGGATCTINAGQITGTVNIPLLASKTASVDKRFRLCVLSVTPSGVGIDEGALQTYTLPKIPAFNIAAPTIAAVATNSVVNPISAGTGALQNQFVDAVTGVPIRLKSINWYGYDGTDLLPHGMYTNRSYTSIMDQIKALGFNAVRLPFSDDFITSTSVFDAVGAPSGGMDNFYVGTNNPDLVGLTPLQAFDAIILYGSQIGLRFILDHHRISMNPINTTDAGYGIDSGYGTDGWPVPTLNTTGFLYGGSTSPRPYTQATWEAMWTALATHCTQDNPTPTGCTLGGIGKYATFPSLANTIVGFDPHNEPHNMNWDTWAGMCESLFTVVNPIAPNWMMFIEGVADDNVTNINDSYCWGGYLKGVSTRPVNLGTKQNKLCYSVHTYGQSVFAQTWLSSHYSTNTGAFAGYPSMPEYVCPNYPLNLEAVMDAYWGFIFKNNIAPVWVGEFGFGIGCDFSTGLPDLLQVNAAYEVQWVQSLVQYLNGGRNDGTSMLTGSQLGISFAYFALNPESGNPLGGLLLNSDYTSVQVAKMSLLNPLIQG